MNPTIVSFQERPELESHLQPLADAVWPPFMHQDPVACKYWGRLFRDFPEYQLAMLDGETLIGAGNAIPFSWDDDLYTLPDEGWDWALEKAMHDADAGHQPKSLVGLQIAISPDYQGRGLSPLMVQKLREVAQSKTLKRVIIPVRPTHKHLYPLISIEDYIKWQINELPFDPWLRVHVRVGGKIIKACPRAMTISGTVSEWESWTNMTFPQTDKYTIAKALTPIHIDRELDKGIYIEPNVWVEHRI